MALPLPHQQKIFNCFQLEGTIDLSVCRKVGFKNVQARKAWHGRFGFNTEHEGICYTLSFPGGDLFPCPPGNICNPTCGCLWEPYQGMPPVNKFLDSSVTAHTETVSIIPPNPTVSADLTRTVSVNRYTGCQTVTACSDSYTDIGTFNGLQNALTGATTVDPCSLGITEHVPPNGAFNIGLMLSFVQPIASVFTCGLTVTATRKGCEPQYECLAYDIPSGNLINRLTVDGIGGTADYFSYTTTGLPICELHISVTETQSYFQVKTWGYSGSDVAGTSEFHVTCTLSNPYTSAQLYQDILQLLHRIDMSNDTQYPWRTDGYISIAPLVTYDEGIPLEPDPQCAIQTLCGDIATCNAPCPFTGQILGDLLPAGFGANFAWNHITFRCCNSGGPNDPTSYAYAYGAWAHSPPASPIPSFTFSTCPPAICPPPPAPPDTVKVDHIGSSGGTLSFYTRDPIPGFASGFPYCAVCGTFAADGIYSLSGPISVPPFYQYTVIGYQINQATFQPGCEGGVIGVCQVNSDTTYYTAGDDTDLAMPPTATQWTENRARLHEPLNAGDLPPGAWLIAPEGGGWLYAQKWAEIKVHRPSYNFARPCGVDKWMLDETKVTCVEHSDGLFPPTLEIYVDTGFVTGDLVYVAGVTGPPKVEDGVYQIVVVDPTHIKLAADATMRPIASATQSGPNVDIVMAVPMNTINSGDSVTIVGVPGLSGAYTVVLTDQTHFSVSATMTGSYGGLGYAFVTGSNAYQDAPETIDFNPGTDGNGIIGKIRLATVPGICGRLSVTSATQQGSKVLITTGTHYLSQGESVDFTGVGVLGTNLPVTVLNSTQFTVVGTLGGTYSGGGYVSVHGAADYRWYDDQSKGQFLYAVYEFNFRDYQQADRMCEQYHGGAYDVCGSPQTGCNQCPAATPGFACIEVVPTVWESDVRQFQLQENGFDRAITGFTIEELCLPFDPCNPQVMAVVPAGSPESFPQPSVTNQFPPTFVTDWRYGSRWQAFYSQHYQDLLWQAPHKPCALCDCGPDDIGSCAGIDYFPSPCPSVEDDGTCQKDTCTIQCTTHVGTNYYAHRPLVESIQNTPASAPTPPFGHIGFPTYEQLTSVVVDPAWPRLLPPAGPGYDFGAGTGGVDPCLPSLHEQPWTLAIKEWLCICSNGRFKQQYIDNGQSVNCPPPSP